MREHSIFCGLLLTALLSGCDSLPNLSDIEIAQTGSLSEWSAVDNTESTVETEDAAETENGVPLPVPNSIRTGVAGADSAEKDSSIFDFPDIELPDVEELAAAQAEPARVTRWSENPVGVYTVLAQQIYACWLNAATPKLENHGFHAEVATGNADEATIVIYQKGENGGRGIQSFRIEIRRSAFTGSSVEAKNRKLDRTQELAFRGDIARWSQGDQQCST
ncbi:MAG: hypothetical protein KTR19_04460 [Hyphomicrobiales bacterium]|nr:hypothetical protein [Hyphomicrobiales bacterium]